MTVVHTQLTDGTSICIREVHRGDRQRLEEGIAKLSDRSRYLRFFSGMKQPPDNVIDKLVDVDGYDHIAWGAINMDLDNRPALGVVHAFRDADDPGNAQFSVAVIDAYQGLGLARLLTAVLLLDCQREGLDELTVHILADNDAALALARSLGGEVTGRERAVVELEIEIEAALASLKADSDHPGLAAVFAQAPSIDP